MLNGRFPLVRNKKFEMILKWYGFGGFAGRDERKILKIESIAIYLL